jgi:hypothetical protein
VEEILEHGDVQFFFRPAVQPADAEGEVTLAVQSFFLILSPAGGRTHRRLRVGKKRMPSRRRDRFWARIERVGSLQRVLGDLLEDEQYSTKTRGERFQPAARPVAAGSYQLVRHDDHVHLRYAVEPFDFIDAPDELKIQESGDHLVLFEAAHGRAVWTHAGSISSLDRDGFEIVLVGACAPTSTDAGADASVST